MGSMAEKIGAESVRMNRDFIRMQSALPSSVGNVFYLDNSRFVIVGKDGVVGSDRYHWNQNDQYQIGKNAGQMILDKILTGKE